MSDSFDYQIDTAFDECYTFSEVAEWYAELYGRLKRSMEDRMNTLQDGIKKINLSNTF